MTKKCDDGGGGVKNYQNLRDVIYGRPYDRNELKKCVTSYMIDSSGYCRLRCVDDISRRCSDDGSGGNYSSRDERDNSDDQV
jgi:hypothetical protein